MLISGSLHLIDWNSLGMKFYVGMETRDVTQFEEQEMLHIVKWISGRHNVIFTFQAGMKLRTEDDVAVW